VTPAAGIRYIDAVRLALSEQLAADDDVVVLGQDVSSGGPFGATAGLADQFGVERVRDTPISEGAVAGLAIGAALMGQRPVLELMFMDFVTLAIDQIVNHAAKLRYMSGGQLSVPLTVRVQGGVGGGYGAHHSQSLEAWLTHVPGLRVFAASTPSDAHRLLTAAIRSDDPTICIEHRALYWDRQQLDDAAPGAGDAVIVRAGSDATIVSWSRMTRTSLEAAEQLAASGIDAEVIDLRSLSPIDVATIVDSVRRTGRLVVASEAVTVGGIGGEIVAAVTEAAGEALVGGVCRVGAPFCPVPAAPTLEQAYAPDAAKIAEAVGQLCGTTKVVV
jgi:pyruvate/2-oxoglutarate/acetoin dehydrogenase E1 component